MSRVLLRAAAAVALGVAISGAWISSPTKAALIHESATLGATGSTGGVSVDSGQFLGSRFSVSSTVDVTSIGGHLHTKQDVGNNLMFGAIVGLSSPTALPTGDPFASGEVVAFTTFNAGSPSTDYVVPLSVTLSSGDYALVFGSALFGATGTGGMPTSNTDISGSASYFFYNGTNWVEDGFSNARFTVGAAVSPVPLPAALPLFLSALAGFGFFGWRRRKQEALA